MFGFLTLNLSRHLLDLHHRASALTTSDSFELSVYTPLIVQSRVWDVGGGPLISAPSSKD